LNIHRWRGFFHTSSSRAQDLPALDGHPAQQLVTLLSGGRAALPLDSCIPLHFPLTRTRDVSASVWVESVIQVRASSLPPPLTSSRPPWRGPGLHSFACSAHVKTVRGHGGGNHTISCPRGGWTGRGGVFDKRFVGEIAREDIRRQAAWSAFPGKRWPKGNILSSTEVLPSAEAAAKPSHSHHAAGTTRPG